MDASVLVADGSRQRVKVSIIARLLGALTYTVPAIGAILGSVLIFNMFRMLRTSETAGVATVMRGMTEASLPVTISLYLAAACGFGLIILLVVRNFVETKTASPPFWFFIVGGLLSLLPALFFWRAQMLIIDVLSPGGSAGAAGISGVAESISRMMWLSIVASPLIFLILLTLSVLPFKGRPGRAWGPPIAAFVTVIALITAAAAVPFLIGSPTRKNEMVRMPAGVRYADIDAAVEKDTSMVITLTADDKLYRRESRDTGDTTERVETLVSIGDLPAKIEQGLEGKTPDHRVAYIKCDGAVSYEKVLEILKAIRNADVDKAAFVVIGEKNEDDPYQTSPRALEVRLPDAADKSQMVKPNPLMLLAALEADGKIKLNNEDAGTTSDAKPLQTRLRSIFKDRENNAVFREGTNEVEKTVFVRAPGSVKYDDFIKLLDAVKGAGAEPIGIQIDDFTSQLAF
jgi:biopolymer transport protein ExbD